MRPAETPYVEFAVWAAIIVAVTLLGRWAFSVDTLRAGGWWADTDGDGDVVARRRGRRRGQRRRGTKDPPDCSLPELFKATPICHGYVPTSTQKPTELRPQPTVHADADKHEAHRDSHHTRPLPRPLQVAPIPFIAHRQYPARLVGQSTGSCYSNPYGQTFAFNNAHSAGTYLPAAPHINLRDAWNRRQQTTPSLSDCRKSTPLETVQLRPDRHLNRRRHPRRDATCPRDRPSWASSRAGAFFPRGSLHRSSTRFAA